MCRFGLGVVLSLMLGTALAEAASTPATDAGLVILVRHAEKQPDVSDPPLSEAGQARALALREALRDVRLAGVIVSDTRRTALTADPVAKSQVIETIVVSTKAGVAAHVADAATQARKLAENGAVLIVGHSNTLPAIVKALGGPERPDLAECAYSNLWVLHLRSDQSAGLIESKYGAAEVGCP
ncbi:MAG: histidine phosphatase family protein [Pseudomonadota bacterium]|nr:histidine phosphatase family protein [Pseudomonadota bacterium]